MQFKTHQILMKTNVLQAQNYGISPVLKEYSKKN